MRSIIIAGNWKMHKTISEARALAEGIKRSLSDFKPEGCEVVLCPAYTALHSVCDVTNASFLQVGAQNVYWEAEGAFTGEVSARMLKDSGCSYVIIGHSERRQLFGETNRTVNAKLKAVLAENLSAIVCVGETLEQRDEGKTFDVLRDHTEGALRGIDKNQMRKVVIAYEPVWAIGTGRTATPAQAQEAHAFIRGLLSNMFDRQTSDTVRILYGGSVKPENTADLISRPDVDGALVGGASLKEESFVDIIRKSLKYK